MTTTKNEPYSLAIVIWHDAHSDGDVWMPEESIDPEPAVVTSVGIILDQVKPGHLTLAQSHVHDHWGTLLHVPISMVEEITILTTIDLGAD